jgi:hypothetical protein
VLSNAAVSQAAAASEAAAGLEDLTGIANPDDVLASILDASGIATQSAAVAQQLVGGLLEQVINLITSLLGGGLPGLPGGEGGLPLPIPGLGDGGLPLPIPGAGEGGLPLPIPGAGEGGLPIPNVGDLPLPIPGVGGEGGLPVPTDAVGLATQLAETLLGALGGTVPTLPGL